MLCHTSNVVMIFRIAIVEHSYDLKNESGNFANEILLNRQRTLQTFKLREKKLP